MHGFHGYVAQEINGDQLVCFVHGVDKFEIISHCGSARNVLKRQPVISDLLHEKVGQMALKKQLRILTNFVPNVKVVTYCEALKNIPLSERFATESARYALLCNSPLEEVWKIIQESVNIKHHDKVCTKRKRDIIQSESEYQVRLEHVTNTRP
jgi:hypothetical protein